MPPSAYDVMSATAADATAIGQLHARSWQAAYQQMLPSEFLGGPVVEDRVALWLRRLAGGGGPGTFVIKAVRGSELLGFACVLRDADAAWGPLLDNLHVRPDLKG